MINRRNGRDLAFRLIFQADVGQRPLDEVFKAARPQTDVAEEVWEFATELASGTWQERGFLDPIIRRLASGWTLERMASADRNLLRLALFEMVRRDDIPPNVSINEAVELAKKYSTVDSAKFINGILGSYARERGEEKP